MENKDDLVEKESPKVAIIGSGVCGLLSARHLSSFCNVKIFETRDTFGGLWNYTDESESNSKSLENNAYYKLYGCLGPSLYDNLRTNIPRFCMLFKDFQIDKDIDKCTSSQEYYKYISDYVKHFDLEQYIKYNTTVLRVKSDEVNNKIMIKSTPTDLSDPNEVVEYFDYALICTGRFSVPNIPKFEGSEIYDGTIVHMHEMRKLDPTLFDDKNVLIVGAGNSAMDLIFFCFFNSETNQQVKPNKLFITSHKVSKFKTSDDFDSLVDSKKLIAKEGNVIKMMTDKQIEFGDGSQETIDTVIYCTGYQICLPFIDPEDNLLEFDNSSERCMYVGPLYKKLFAAKNPRVMFPGLVCRQFLGNAVFEKQAMLCAQFIKGDLKLPTVQEMIEEVDQERQYLKENNENYYCFGYINCAFRYMQDIGAISIVPEDKRYYSFKPIQNMQYDLKSKGKELEYRNTDYKSLFEGILFEPTSELF